MAKCEVCSKRLMEECIEKHGKKFCCKECTKHYEDKNKSNKKPKVCEFC